MTTALHDLGTKKFRKLDYSRNNVRNNTTVRIMTIRVYHLCMSPAGAENELTRDMYFRLTRADRSSVEQVLAAPHEWTELGLSYQAVADVNYCDDPEEAYAKTNHIEWDWGRNRGVHLLTSNPRRSTSVGDYMVGDDGAVLLVDRCGFTKLDLGMSNQPRQDYEEAAMNAPHV
ncbi:MAG: hypothetical protein EPN79_11470 [Burkholderiaceae bacterium]|nr:MAG: hypothetical protein EPN79_11470 [Burkholderiaceae bacterium]TBR76696.1 MAG: hypothetical protein EPN64_05595 [Burkholderiaceae bacterium]